MLTATYQEKQRWPSYHMCCWHLSVYFFFTNILTNTDRRSALFLAVKKNMSMNVHLKGTKAAHISCKDKQKVWVNRFNWMAQFDLSIMSTLWKHSKPTKNFKFVWTNWKFALPEFGLSRVYCMLSKMSCYTLEPCHVTTNLAAEGDVSSGTTIHAKITLMGPNRRW